MRRRIAFAFGVRFAWRVWQVDWHILLVTEFSFGLFWRHDIDQNPSIHGYVSNHRTRSGRRGFRAKRVIRPVRLASMARTGPHRPFQRDWPGQRVAEGWSAFGLENQRPWWRRQRPFRCRWSDLR